jgi:isovaleryl-CoA dehydrogenase
MSDGLSSSQEAVLQAARRVAQERLRPLAAEVDRTRAFPHAGFDAIHGAGLMGLMSPQSQGGLGGDLLSLVLVCEQLGQGCASTAMCYLMHACGTAVIAARAENGQEARFLGPIAKGQLMTTLAFSERGTGAHFYAPEITAEHKDGGYVLNGVKSFVTSGGAADLYLALANSAEPGKGTDVLALEKSMPGVSFDGQWEGLGFAGNQSIRMILKGVFVPAKNLIGQPGDGASLVFDVVAPTFLLGVSAVNLGIAQAALDASVEHAKNRKYGSGQSLANIQAIQFYLAEMRITIDSARALLYHAARLADSGESAALLAVMESKVAACDAAIAITNKAMQVCGGQGYTRSLPVERHYRDGRASAVMAPTTEVLKEWIGKTLCDIPLF